MFTLMYVRMYVYYNMNSVRSPHVYVMSLLVTDSGAGTSGIGGCILRPVLHSLSAHGGRCGQLPLHHSYSASTDNGTYLYRVLL